MKIININIVSAFILFIFNNNINYYGYVYIKFTI